MALTIDKLTGNIYLFDTSGGGGTGATSFYPEVNSFSQLPPASSASTLIYIVRQSTGVYLINRKEAGMYYSNGVTWSRLGDIPSFFNDDNFQVYDGTDNTKALKFQLSGITANNTRTVIIPNSSGTMAYLSDLTTKIDSANNGLTKNGTNVRLGGSLTGSTTLNLNSNNLFFPNGNLAVGNTGITTNTRVDIKGIGTSTNNALRVADSNNVERFKILDSGVIANTPLASNSHTITATYAGSGTNQYVFGIVGTFTLPAILGSTAHSILLNNTLNSVQQVNQVTTAIKNITTFNYSQSGGTSIGYDYQPTLTGAGVATLTHIAARFASGSVVIGTTTNGSLNTRIDIRGLTTAGSSTTLRLADAGNNGLFTVLDNGTTTQSPRTPGSNLVVGGAGILINGAASFLSTNIAVSAGISSITTPAAQLYKVYLVNNGTNAAFTAGATGGLYGYSNEPVLNSTASTVTHIGFNHNPLVTNWTGTHLAIRAVSGNVLIGGTGITTNTKVEIRGLGLGNILRLSNSSNVERFRVQDNGTSEFTGTLNVISAASNSATYTATVSGTLGANGVTLGLNVGGGTVTMRSTANDGVRFMAMGGTVTTGAVNQSITGYVYVPTHTINHTGVNAYGYFYSPSFNGSQAPANDYAFYATRGVFLLGGTGITTNTRVDIRGFGAGTNTALRLAGSGNTVVFQVLNNGSIGFYGTAPVVKQTGGADTASGLYTATEQGMIQRMYDALRNYGLLT